MRNKRKTRAEIEALSQWALEKAVSRDAVVGADIIYFYGVGHSLSLRDGEPEENTSGVSGGLGIRIINSGGRQGIAYSNNLSRHSVNELIDWSYANSLVSEPEEHISLYAGAIDSDEESLSLFDVIVEQGIAHSQRMESCLEMTDIARRTDKRVVSVRSASCGDGVGESFYASSSGLSGWRRSTSVSCGVSVVLGDGDSHELGGYGKTERYFSDIKREEYATLAVEKTARILSGKPLPTSQYTLLLDPEITASLIDEIGALFCASDVHKGRSMMKGKLGEKISDSCITLIDDARIPKRSGSSLFDGEGFPTGRTVLIESGVAKNYIYNMQYAAKDGVISTGNASRSFSSLPDVGNSNLILEAGSDTQESLIKRVSNGFLVLELMGLHTLDPVSGDFSLGAKGIRITNGILGEPVAGVTIAGNLLDLLGKASAVGSDQEFFGSVAASTLLVEDIAVAGC